MASKSRDSGPSAWGSSTSSAWSISSAAAAMARGRAGASILVFIGWGPLLHVAQAGATRALHDGLHLHLRFRQLGLAMAAEGGAALVIRDRLGERAPAAFQRLHDILKLPQRLL